MGSTLTGIGYDFRNGAATSTDAEPNPESASVPEPATSSRSGCDGKLSYASSSRHKYHSI